MAKKVVKPKAAKKAAPKAAKPKKAKKPAVDVMAMPFANDKFIFIDTGDEKKYLKELEKAWANTAIGDVIAGTGFGSKKIRNVLDNFFNGIKGGHERAGDVWYYRKIPQ